MIAIIINAAAVIVGTLIGLPLKGHLSERFSKIVLQGLALCVSMIGIQMAVAAEDMLGVVLCVAVGAALGEALRIEDRLDKMGDFLRSKVERKKAEGAHSTFKEAFVTSTILFSVGAMAIIGSLEAGFSGNYTTILAKSTIDGITSILLAAALGVGVAFSSIPLFLYQGLITLSAGLLREVLAPEMIVMMSATGGLLVLAIGLKMLGTIKIKISNLLPAIFLPIAYISLRAWIGTLM